MRYSFKFLLLLIALLCGYGVSLAEDVRIAHIYLENNKVTKRNTVIRELPFKEGEIVSSSKLESLMDVAQANLTNTSLFNIIELDYKPSADEQAAVDVYIRVEERWYWWPVVDILLEDRNMSSWFKEGDLGRITFNLGGRVENLMGLNNTLQVAAIVGFQKGAKFSLSNIALDASRKQFIDVYGRFSMARTENVGTEDNAPHYVKTYDRFISESFKAGGSYTYRRNVRTRHSVALDVENKRIDDTILTLNPHFWGDQRTRRFNFTLSYNYVHDERNYRLYPTNGYYIGTGVKTYWSDDFNVRYAQATFDLRYYKHLYKRWYGSSMLRGGVSVKNSDAYILDHAIGYNDINLRGYEYYVADGQHYLLSNNTVSFNFLPKTIVPLEWMKWAPQFHKIYFSVFGRAYVDMGYAHNNRPFAGNNLSNRFLISSGVGIDIITFYDIVLSFDYAFNREGTPGFYFQIRAPFF